MNLPAAVLRLVINYIVIHDFYRAFLRISIFALLEETRDERGYPEIQLVTQILKMKKCIK